MTKLNEKPLSQMLEAMEPKDGRIETMFMSKEVVAHWVDRASYDKLKAVAIELAICLEKQKFCVTFCDDTHKVRDKALSRAKDIIGEG